MDSVTKQFILQINYCDSRV